MRTDRLTSYLPWALVLWANVGTPPFSAAAERLVPDTYSTIQAAIDASTTADIVIIAPGTYTGTGNRDIDFKGKAITVRSTDPNDPNVVAATVIDCQASGTSRHRGFYFHSGEGPNSVVAGLTVTRGNAPSAYNGGGIHCDHSSPTISRCCFTANVASYYGGGIWAGNLSSPTIVGCTFIGNKAQDGAGICSSGGSATISGCTFTGNTGGQGCGIGCQNGSSARISGCTISGNSAVNSGGGFCSYSGSPTLTNCLIAGNYARNPGGGICSPGSVLTVSHCTIAGNSSDSYGAGVYCDPNTRIVNSIVWDNVPDGIAANSGSPAVTFSDIQGGRSGDGNINADPCFVLPDDFHLLQGSPCIDAGTDSPPNGLAPVDLDGYPRRMGARTDMGAYERSTQCTAALAVSPKSMALNAFLGSESTGETPLFICNFGEAMLNWQIAPGATWLTSSLVSGSTAPGETAQVALGVDPNGLSRGQYGCVLSVTDPQALYSPQSVQVSLRVNGVLRVPSEYATIQQAIDAAIAGDVVLLADGTYTGTGNRDLDPRGKAIAIRSENGPASCIIDCQSSGRGIYFHTGESADTVIDGLTIRNGRATTGGALYCDGASPTLSNCVLTNNVGTDQGGAVYCGSANATFRNCTIKGNTVQWYGGGIHCSACNVTISGCTIVGNRSLGYDKHNGVFGGALFFTGAGSSTVSNCVLSGNIAQCGGGACVKSGASAKFTNCLISGNYTTDCGGGLMVYLSGILEVENCRICANFSPEAGGIVAMFYCVLKVTNTDICGNVAALQCGGVGYQGCWSNASSILQNCTIAGNTAMTRVGGVGLLDSRSSVKNCIVWGNVDNFANLEPNRPTIQMGIGIESGNPSVLTVSYSDVQDGPNRVRIEGGSTLTWGTGNIDADPEFVDGSSGTLTADGAYDANACQVTLTDATANWPVNGLAGKLVQVNLDPPTPLQFPIISNTQTTLTLWAYGAMVQTGSSLIPAGAGYSILDYHLLKTSPCLDAGDPNGNYTGQTDIDGQPRLMTDSVEIGADEVAVIRGADWRFLPDGPWTHRDCGAGASTAALLSMAMLFGLCALRRGRSSS